jgi:formylglycine-generating enzyme required for sulfatase activity
MVGNVWEWCSSLQADYPYRADDGREDLAAEGWRALRGGSWLDHEWGVRAGRRLSGQPDRASHNTGFRAVQEI